MLAATNGGLRPPRPLLEETFGVNLPGTPGDGTTTTRAEAVRIPRTTGRPSQLLHRGPAGELEGKGAGNAMYTAMPSEMESMRAWGPRTMSVWPPRKFPRRPLASGAAPPRTKNGS